MASEKGKKIFIVDVVAEKGIKKANIIELFLRNIGEFINGNYIFK